MRKVFVASNVLFLFLQVGAHAQSLEKMVEQLERKLKNESARKLVVIPFPYEDGRTSPGSAAVAENLFKSFSNLGFELTDPKEILNKMQSWGMDPARKIGDSELATLGRDLKADVVIYGTLKDSKKQVDLRVVLLDLRSSRWVGTGEASLAKSWKDPPPEACNSLQYVNKATTTYERLAAAEMIQVVLTDPWWPVQTLGLIEWRYCKPGKTPNPHEAMIELKKKAWEAGGKTLVVRKSEPDPVDRKILILKAEVVR